MAHAGRLGGGDRGGGVIDADARRQQEQLFDALEGGREHRRFAEIADGAFGALRQAGGAGGIACEDAKLRALRVEFGGERAADVSCGAGDQYHRCSSSRCRLTIAHDN